MNKEKEITIFDKEEKFEERVRPILNELAKVCREEDIFYVYSFCTKSTKDETTYVNDGRLTGSNGINLVDDRLTQALLAISGGKFIGYEQYRKELDEQMDDLVAYICEDGEIVEEVVSTSH